MIEGLIGFVFIGLTILFHEKKCERMKVLCYYASIVFLAIAAISVWVGDFRSLIHF